jgi:hypothetical protein
MVHSASSSLLSAEPPPTHTTPTHSMLAASASAPALRRQHTPDKHQTSPHPRGGRHRPEGHQTGHQTAWPDRRTVPHPLTVGTPSTGSSSSKPPSPSFAHTNTPLAKALLTPGILLSSFYTVVTLLLHCCYTVVTLLLHCCYTLVTLLLHFRCTVVTLLLHCCYTVVTLFLHCCHPVFTLLTPGPIYEPHQGKRDGGVS